MTRITIERNNGKTAERTGTSGIALTCAISDDAADVEIELDIADRTECIVLVGALLAQMEHIGGEELVAQCLGHYANLTDKKSMKREGEKDLVILKVDRPNVHRHNGERMQ